MAKKKSRSNSDNKAKNNINNVTSRRDSEKSFSSTLLSRSNPYGANVNIYFIISLIAVVASILWKYVLVQKHDSTITTVNLDSSLEILVHVTCQNDDCNRDALHAQNRALFSGRRLDKKSKLFEIPRAMQIWSLDAFRDEFVKTNLKGARHPKTNIFLVEQAFLAAYLAMLIKRNIATHNLFDGDRNHTTSSIYLENLPTYDDYRLHHPVTFDLTELDELYGAHTHTYFLVSKRKEEIESEYEAFIRASSEFGNFISYQEYITARLNVQTRAFEGGPLNDRDAPLKELDWYKKKFGVDVKKKFTAMVPLLDAFSSHDKEHNVEYHYDPESKKYVAYASNNIKRGTELVGTRGDRADLFPTYGFVYGDFSERTSVLLGGHQVVDVRVVSESTHIREQKNEIIVYLQQDDGYKQCVAEDDVLAMQFKRLKRQALLSIVNGYKNWIVSFPALDRNMKSGRQMHISVDTGVNQIISTSRLLALSHRDYDGNAYNVLKTAVEEIESNDGEDTNDKPLFLKSGGDGLEYRALVWVWRLAAHSLNRYCGRYDEWICSAAERSEMDSFEEKSKEWYAAYVRYQEIVALETLKEFAQQSYIEYTKNENYDSEAEEYFFRSTLCPTDSPRLKELIYE